MSHLVFSRKPARFAAARLADTPGVSLVMPPTLGVVLFRRDGWGRDEWKQWGDHVLREGIAFVEVDIEADRTTRAEVRWCLGGRARFVPEGKPRGKSEALNAEVRDPVVQCACLDLVVGRGAQLFQVDPVPRLGRPEV